jgi:hypothetical protein
MWGTSLGRKPDKDDQDKHRDWRHFLARPSPVYRHDARKGGLLVPLFFGVFPGGCF